MTVFTAWLDESGSNQALDPRTYLLSAVISETSQVPQAREVMRGPLLSKGGKLHWRDEGRRHQEQISQAIARLNIEHLVVVRSSTTATRPERQRQLCVERMLPELVALGVGTAVFESRGPKDDRHDRRTLEHLRRKQMITGGLQIDHVGGRTEPMLRIADACCGTITQLRCGDRYHYSLIESKVTIISI